MKQGDARRHDQRLFRAEPGMLRRLDRIGERGRARIVLASKNDHGAAIWASRFTYAGLLRKGVEIYEYQPTKLHTKLFVIDDTVYIGSANYDIRSLFLNLELMLRIEDKAFAAHVRGYVDGEIAKSERITPGALQGAHQPVDAGQAGRGILRDDRARLQRHAAAQFRPREAHAEA